MMNEGIMIIADENGVFKEYKPYATIDVETEEDYKILEEAIKIYKNLPNLLQVLEKNKDEKTIKLLEEVLDIDSSSLKNLK